MDKRPETPEDPEKGLVPGRTQHKPVKSQERDWLLRKKAYLFPKPKEIIIEI